MEINHFTLRAYDKATDQAAVEAWLATHGKAMFHPGLFPPLGVVAYDEQGMAAVAFAHLSVGCAVAILEPGMARPGLSLKETHRAFELILDAIKRACHANHYSVLMVHTKPAIARFLGKQGFQELSDERKVDMFFNLNEMEGK